MDQPEDIETGSPSDPILPKHEPTCVKSTCFALCLCIMVLGVLIASIMVSLIIMHKAGAM